MIAMHASLFVRLSGRSAVVNVCLTPVATTPAVEQNQGLMAQDVALQEWWS